MTNYLQVQEITLVTPLRFTNLTQDQACYCVKKLPFIAKNNGYNDQIHFRALFIFLVNFVEGRIKE